MKKIVMLTLMTVTLLMGCGTAEAEENSYFRYYYDFVVLCESLTQEAQVPEDIETIKKNLISALEEHWIELNIGEGDKNEIIKIFNNRSGYFPELSIEQNLEIIQDDYITLLTIYDVLPDEYRGLNFYQITTTMNN